MAKREFTILRASKTERNMLRSTKPCKEGTRNSPGQTVIEVQTRMKGLDPKPITCRKPNTEPIDFEGYLVGYHGRDDCGSQILS
jgi:hypothetical protein